MIVYTCGLLKEERTMLRVVDLLALPIFAGFRLENSGEGIYNEIEGVGILEWEDPEDIYETFSRGDMVFTTLYMQDSNRSKGDAGVEALLRLGVSAVSFKLADKSMSLRDILPERLITMADKLKIPLLTYSDTYLEDLIFTVRSSLLAKDSNTIALDCLKRLMGEKEENLVTAARNLNPLFYNNIRCLCCIPLGCGYGEDAFREALDRALAGYRKTFSGQMHNPDSHDSLIRCEKCIVIIHTSKFPEREDTDAILRAGEVLKEFNINQRDFAVGISSPRRGLGSMREAISESMTAAVHGVLENEAFCRFEDTGSDMVLVPFFRTEAYREFYRSRLDRLTEYDNTHDSALTDTLMAYTDSLLDVKLTASRLYQHPNTVRYRLSRIREIMNADKSPEGLLEMMIFSRIHKTVKILGAEALI